MLALLALLATEPQAAAAAWNSTVVGVLNAASRHSPTCRMGLPKAVFLGLTITLPNASCGRSWDAAVVSGPLSIRFQKLDSYRLLFLTAGILLSLSNERSRLCRSARQPTPVLRSPLRSVGHS